ncbi:hypothetical protein N2152v2_004696 [Parachlorella kessleri]
MATLQTARTWKAARFRGLTVNQRQGSLAPAVEGDGPWTAEDSALLYNVDGWGAPYFSVSRDGTLLVKPAGTDSYAVDLHKLVLSLQHQGIRPPFLIRFLDIIDDRIAKLNAAFNAAIQRFEYQGVYQGVFPVKCNHDKDLLRSVVEFGKPYNFGLEVGSKAELVMVMSLLADHPGSNLVCNGYKDEEYMELVLHARELGINAMVVMEQFSELGMVLSVAKRLGVRPAIGIRAKLNTQHRGHWGSTSGDRAKFGLRAREIVAVVRQLREEGLLDCLQLLHYHAGSQITSIREVKEVMRESTFLFAELVQMGAGMKYIDVGGGLAVDYDGSFTDTNASMSYTIQNYANDVVSAMQEVCIQRDIPAPTILSESGRALASHHAVLVFDVLTKPCTLHESNKRKEEGRVLERMRSISDDNSLTRQLTLAARQSKGQFLLTSFKEVFDAIWPDDSSLREAFTDAVYFKDEALRAFKLGVLSLEERAEIETMYDATCQKIRETAETYKLAVPESLRPTTLPGPKNMYHINLSVFRSAVDSWGIQQAFPIMPIHRLGEEPNVLATLADLTCDSDGKLDRFINPKGGEPLPALPLHDVRAGETYYLAMFLTGVYQEVMGSMHNMFGSLNTVVVKAGEPQAVADSGDGISVSMNGAAVGQGLHIQHVVAGNSIANVLANAQHGSTEMLESVRAAAEHAVGAGRLTAEAAERLLDNFNTRLHGYTAGNSSSSSIIAVVLDYVQVPMAQQQEQGGQQEGLQLHTGRTLQVAPSCSLGVASAQHTFDGCHTASSSPAVTLFYSLSRDPGTGGTLVRGGISASGVGWAGWGFGSTQMSRTKAIIVKADTSVPTGASVAGYVLPSSGAASGTNVNAARGSWALSSPAASLTSGTLAAVFTVSLASSMSALTSSPYPYIYATGSVNSGTGPIRTHTVFASGTLQFPAPGTSPPSPSPGLSPSPSSPLPMASPSPTQEGSDDGGGDGGDDPGHHGQGGVTPSPAFSPPASLPPSPSPPGSDEGSDSNLQWQGLPATTTGRRLQQQQEPSTARVLFGLNGTTQGSNYVALGFPATEDTMVGANAFVVQDCDSCPLGASIQGYYLGGYTASSVQPPAQLPAASLFATRTTSADGQMWLSGSFVVELDASVLTSSVPLIFAQGATSGGRLLQHDTEGGAVLPDGLQGGAADLHAGDSLDARKAAHAWLMTISWGVMIPAGIVVARCFKELDPLWFKLHRAVQCCGFLLSIAGFGLGFSIHGSWSTPYPVHRNLGVAVTALGLAQVTALFARPLKTSPVRRYWNWNHCGIIHVEQLGAWAYATYTAVLGVIIAVWLVKDSLDLLRRQRRLVGKSPTPAITNQEEAINITAVASGLPAPSAVELSSMHQPLGGHPLVGGTAYGSLPASAGPYYFLPEPSA